MSDSPSGPSWKSADLVKQFFVSVSDNVPFFFALGVVAALLSVCPDKLLSAAKDWRWLFAGISLFAFLYLAAHRWDRFYIWRQAVWQLKHLGVDEQNVLKDYLLENKSTGYFGIKHGVVATLIGKGILIYSSGIIWGVGDNAVAIQPYAMKYLRKRPELVGVKKEEIGSKEPSGPLRPTHGLGEI